MGWAHEPDMVQALNAIAAVTARLRTDSMTMVG
jgi:hypothetical protein